MSIVKTYGNNEVDTDNLSDMDIESLLKDYMMADSRAIVEVIKIMRKDIKDLKGYYE